MHRRCNVDVVEEVADVVDDVHQGLPPLAVRQQPVDGRLHNRLF